MCPSDSDNSTEHLQNKPDKSGIPRLIAATGYSMKGLKAAWQYEEAFRLEVCLAAIFVPLSFIVGETLTHQLILVISCALVLLAELVNSAIEAVVDRVSAEIHPLSGQAKDIGSAAVFLTMSLFLGVWGLSVWAYLLG